MARPLRIELAGGLYHVMSRGNARRPIVRDDADRQRRLDWLQRTVETYGWWLHAFTLLTNHEHLFLEMPEANLSAGMHLLNGSYSGYFNVRHRRAGHLFQGRFKAHLIEEEGYFTEISRYLHLNPVRAKLVSRPAQWRYSMVEIAKSLGYSGHSGVGTAVARVEAAGRGIHQTLADLERRLASA
jgi:putative transposase